MSFETALRSRLKAEASLAVASIEWVKRPQSSFPAIVLTLVSLPLARHMKGFGPWQRARVQIDVMALNAPQKTTLRDTVLAVIAPSALSGAFRFGRAIEVSVADQSEETDTDFVHRDRIEAVLPFMQES